MVVRAALLRAPRSPVAIAEVNLEDPKRGEVRVRIRAAGICHSDWHVVTGDTRHPMPVVLGHEGAGIVDAVGPTVSRVKVGDHVALNWAPACGTCFYCDKGRPNLCATYVGPIWAGTMLDGTTRLREHGEPVYHYCGLACFAEYCVVPDVSCVPMPADIPFPIAAVIGCAVATGVGSVLNTAKVGAGSSVAVFGAGGVGLSTVIGAKLAGADTIIAVDPLAARRHAALEFGATHALEPTEHVANVVRSLTHGRGADFTFEAAGIPQVQEICLDATRPGGSVVLSGLAPMGSATNFPGAIVVREEKSVLGSYYGSSNPSVDFVQYAALYAKGALPLDRLVSRFYRLDEINEGFADMLSGATRRGVIVMDE
ncbi:MAG: alcohol dehydrogenase catalytic domain-containing protein [Fimbriimonadaceae bacterium]